MPTLKQTVLGLVMLGFGFTGAALTPTPAWAERGGGISVFHSQNSPDEDEKPESQPLYFTPSGIVMYDNLPTGNHLYMSSTEVPASRIVLVNNLPNGLGLRLDFTYDTDDDETDQRPASTFRGWARTSILDELETDNDLREEPRPKSARDSVQEWLGDEVFESLQEQFSSWSGGYSGVDFTGDYSF